MRKEVPGLFRSPKKGKLRVSYAKHTTRYDELTEPEGVYRTFSNDDFGSTSLRDEAPAGDRGF